MTTDELCAAMRTVLPQQAPISITVFVDEDNPNTIQVELRPAITITADMLLTDAPEQVQATTKAMVAQFAKRLWQAAEVFGPTQPRGVDPSVVVRRGDHE